MAIIWQSLNIGCKNFCLWEKMQKKFSANEKKKTLTIYKRTCENCGNLTEGSQMKNSDKENLGRWAWHLDFNPWAVIEAHHKVGCPMTHTSYIFMTVNLRAVRSASFIMSPYKEMLGYCANIYMILYIYLHYLANTKLDHARSGLHTGIQLVK